MPRHIRKGDTVIVTAGNDKGMTGEVLRIGPFRRRTRLAAPEDTKK